MRRTLGLGFLFLGLLLTLAAPAAFAAEEKKAAEAPVAMVNGATIGKSEYDAAVQSYERQVKAMGGLKTKEEMASFKKEVLDNLINSELLYQQAKKEGVKVDDAAVNAEYTKWKGQFPGDAEYKKVMEEWKLDEGDLKEQIRKNAMINQFIDKKFAKEGEVPEAEIKAYYDAHPEYFKKAEQVRASHILVKVEPNATEAQKAEAKKKLQEIKGRIDKGEAFDFVAKTASDCPSKDNGGDLGYFGRGQMVKPFEDTAFSLEPGKMSDIVETQFGYHLILVKEKKPEGPVPFEEVKPKIAEFLKREQVRKAVVAYSADLRKQAKVEVFLPEEKKEAPKKK